MEILILDTEFKAIAALDSFKSVIWTDRYNEYGDVEICFSMEPKLLEFLKEDYYLWIKESEHCMIVESLAIDSDVEEGNHLIVTGRSLESILERRIVWGQKVLNGSLQNAIRTLLNEAVISPGMAERRIGNFMFKLSTDERITKLTIDTQYTGDDLYTIISSLCAKNNIGFKIVLDDFDRFVFSLYAGSDRSYDQTVNPYVIFSPSFDNIINSNYFTSKANLKTVTLIAGEGEGTARKTAVVGSGAGLNRRELFTDARDISSDTEDGTLSEEEYIAKLKSRGATKLAEHEASTAFEGEVEATQLFKYGEDFFIGDTVQITNEYGHEGAAYISEIVVSQNEEGRSVYPTFKMISEEKEDGA